MKGDVRFSPVLFILRAAPVICSEVRQLDGRVKNGLLLDLSQALINSFSSMFKGNLRRAGARDDLILDLRKGSSEVRTPLASSGMFAPRSWFYLFEILYGSL